MSVAQRVVAGVSKGTGGVFGSGTTFAHARVIVVAFMLVAYATWLTTGPRGDSELLCDPVLQACFDRRPQILTTDAGISELCGDVDALAGALERDGIAIVSLYTFRDSADAEHYDASFARVGIQTLRRHHAGGHLRAVVALTPESFVPALVAFAELDLCPLGLSVVPGAIVR